MHIPKYLQTKSKDPDEDEEEGNIDFDDLIEKPRLQSVPKLTYNLEYDEYSTDFDIKEYSYKLQNYIREKNKIIHDQDYRNELIKNKKIIEKGEESAMNHLNSDNKVNKKRGPAINENIEVKVVDLGNACWIHHHFSTEIQTRQYRSPEVILGVKYDTSSDLWSFACMIFELITGDFLFEPRKGESYSKNDDHLAQIMELLGKMPKKLALSGRYSKKYFNRVGNLRRIKGLQYWPLKSVLMEKYKIKEEEAIMLADFLLPMLRYYPNRRATAQEMLSHPWLTMNPNFEYQMSEREHQSYLMKNKTKSKSKNEKEEDAVVDNCDFVDSEEDLNMADDEDNDEISCKEDDDSFVYESNEEDGVIKIQNFNNSFAAYGQHINLSSLDRSNPQFEFLNK